MKLEIERKFLVSAENLQYVKENASFCELIHQGYLSKDPEVRVRLRNSPITLEDSSCLTIKSKGGLSREEFEFSIPVEDAKLLLLTMCASPIIFKARWHMEKGWTVDEFFRELDGLVLAEIELPHENTELTPPSWVGTEVTFDKRYKNSWLVQFGIPL